MTGWCTGEAPNVVGDPATGGAYLRREQFRQIQGEPAEEQSCDKALRKSHWQKGGLQWRCEKEKAAGQHRRTQTYQKIREPSAEHVGKLCAEEAAKNGPKCYASRCGAQHQTRREARKPISSQSIRKATAKQTLNS